MLKGTLLCFRGHRQTAIWQLSSAGKYRIVSWYDVKQVSNLIRKWLCETECIEYGRDEQTVMVWVHGLVTFLFYFVVTSSHLLSLFPSHSFFSVYTCVSLVCHSCVLKPVFLFVSSSVFILFPVSQSRVLCYPRSCLFPELHRALYVMYLMYVCFVFYLPRLVSVSFVACHLCLPLDFRLGSLFCVKP